MTSSLKEREVLSEGEGPRKKTPETSIGKGCRLLEKKGFLSFVGEGKGIRRDKGGLDVEGIVFSNYRLKRLLSKGIFGAGKGYGDRGRGRSFLRKSSSVKKNAFVRCRIRGWRVIFGY